MKASAPWALSWGDSAFCAQVAERQQQAWEAEQQQEEDEEEARQAEQFTNALLQQEAKMMAERGHRPKVGSLQVTAHHCWATQLAPVLQDWSVPSSASQPARVLPCSCVSPFLD